MKIHRLLPLFILLLAATAFCQAPPLLNYQGRVVVDGVNFSGSGQFKFAIVDETDAVLWTNTDDANADGVPDTCVAITVANGLYSTLLGDTDAGMLAQHSTRGCGCGSTTAPTASNFSRRTIALRPRRTR